MKKENDNKYTFLTISFKQGFTSPNIPICSFHQGNKKLNLLLDSGSDSNVINARILNEFEHVMVGDSSPVCNITGMGGTKQVSACELSFEYGDNKYNEIFLVTDMGDSFGLVEEAHSIQIHGILGTDFFRKNNIVLDFNNMIAYNDKQEG